MKKKVPVNKLIIVCSSIICMNACAPSIQKIGTLNMIAHRNVDMKLDYELIATYSGGSNRELKKARYKTVEDALESTVRKVPGGEMLLNVKLYQIKGKYYAVEGDVWGKSGENGIRGFHVGDQVVCKDVNFIKKMNLSSNDIVYGVITGLIDDKSVYIKLKGTERTIKVPLEKITKSERE
jgi:hypothetical protein